MVQPLYERYRDDDETAGILAGVYKRLWQKTDDLAELERADELSPRLGTRAGQFLPGHQCRHDGVWLDHMPLARRVAAEVEALLALGRTLAGTASMRLIAIIGLR